MKKLILVWLILVCFTININLCLAETTRIDYTIWQYDLSAECSEWAFGPQWPTLKLSDVDIVWNSKHSDLFLIHGSDDYKETFHRIENLCEEKKATK